VRGCAGQLFNTMRGPIMERIEAGKPINMLALAVAGYSRYMMGVDEGGAPITIKDPMAANVHSCVWKVRAFVHPSSYCRRPPPARVVETLVLCVMNVFQRAQLSGAPHGDWL
jgi:hypothetical protein